MLQFSRIAALPNFKQGVAYVVRGGLYLSLTNARNAGASLLESRGPGFAMSAESGFSELDEEPTAEYTADLIDSIYGQATESMGSMGELDHGITFAGILSL
jgi:hypothetical protein